MVHDVTFSSQELFLRLNQRWRFLSVEGRVVRIVDEPVAEFEKRGAKVTLKPLGPRDAVRWVAWAIAELCPGAEAADDEADPSRITSAPLGDDEVQALARDIVAQRHAAIAREADPKGGAHEAVALVSYLVKKGHLEVSGEMAAVARAVMPCLETVDDTVGQRLEDVLLELDEVEELFAESEDIAKVVLRNDHVLDW